MGILGFQLCVVPVFLLAKQNKIYCYYRSRDEDRSRSKNSPALSSLINQKTPIGKAKIMFISAKRIHYLEFQVAMVQEGRRDTFSLNSGRGRGYVEADRRRGSRHYNHIHYSRQATRGRIPHGFPSFGISFLFFCTRISIFLLHLTLILFRFSLINGLKL